MKKRLIILVALVGSFLLPFSAASDPLEDTVTYRQGILFGIGWNVGAMGAMVKGDVSFDRDKFVFLAQRTSVLIPMVLEGFKLETKEIESNTKSNAWSNLSDFEERFSTLSKGAEELVRIAEVGTESEIKKQFGVTAKQCKGCHDKYKKSN